MFFCTCGQTPRNAFTCLLPGNEQGLAKTLLRQTLILVHQPSKTPASKRHRTCCCTQTHSQGRGMPMASPHPTLTKTSNMALRTQAAAATRPLSPSPHPTPPKIYDVAMVGVPVQATCCHLRDDAAFMASNRSSSEIVVGVGHGKGAE